MGQRIAIELFLMVAAGVILGLIGPFGTFDTPLAQRILWWVIMIVAGYPLFRGLGSVARWVADATSVPYPIAVALGLAIAAMPMTLIVAWLFMRVDPVTALQSPRIIAFYGQVLVVGLIIHGGMWLLMRPPADGAASMASLTVSESGPALAPVATPDAPLAVEASVPTAETAPPPSLPLPPGFGALLALKAEDHYLRAISAEREAMFLMRLRDAIALLPDDAGVQVHRSWWVAKDAVTGVARDGRAAMLTLNNGAEVPVARDRMAAVKAAGWTS